MAESGDEDGDQNPRNEAPQDLQPVVQDDQPPTQRRRLGEELQPHSTAMAMSNEIVTCTVHCKLADIHESRVNACVRTGKGSWTFSCYV